MSGKRSLKVLGAPSLSQRIVTQTEQTEEAKTKVGKEPLYPYAGPTQAWKSIGIDQFFVGQKMLVFARMFARTIDHIPARLVYPSSSDRTTSGLQQLADKQ